MKDTNKKIEYLLHLYEQGDKMDADALRTSITHISNVKKRCDYLEKNIICSVFYSRKLFIELDVAEQLLFSIGDILSNKNLRLSEKENKLKKVVRPFFLLKITPLKNIKNIGERLQRIKDEIVSRR